MAEPQKKSFFAKVKQWLGIGTVKVEVDIPNSTVTLSTKEIPGKIILSGKGDQHVNGITIVAREYWTQKELGGKETQKCFELGTMTLNKVFDIKKGETKTFEFVLPIRIAKSAEDQLIEKGGMLGKIGSLSAGLRQKSKMTLCATADVEGAAFDPNQIVSLNFKREA